MQTLDYDGKIEGVDPDDDGVEHYRLVRMPTAVQRGARLGPRSQCTPWPAFCY